jgi:Tol biopolymer transport system component
MDGSPAVRLGSGAFPALSPDGKWVAAIDNGSPQQLELLPTGTGQKRQVTNDALEHLGARWTPDGMALVFTASEPNHALRTYWMSLDEGKSRPITPEGTAGTLVSPDGKYVLALDAQNKRWLYPLAGGDPQPVSAVLKETETALSWEPDGQSLLVGERGFPFNVTRVYLNSTRRDNVRTVSPSDAAGIVTLGGIRFSADRKSYAYSYYRILSDLYVVDGLR